MIWRPWLESFQYAVSVQSPYRRLYRDIFLRGGHIKIIVSNRLWSCVCIFFNKEMCFLNHYTNMPASADSGIHGVYKRMVRFQKLIKILFLNLRGHNIHCQQRELSTFLMRYTNSLPMLTAGPRGQFPRWRRSRRRLSVCSVLRWSRSVITVQREVRARLKTRRTIQG
jgi:hypothetical protein